MPTALGFDTLLVEAELRLAWAADRRCIAGRRFKSIVRFGAHTRAIALPMLPEEAASAISVSAA